jgi:hypothetical protein
MSLAIGADFNDPNGMANAGHVRVYQWNGSSWNQRGSDIDGKNQGNTSGKSVSLSSDGSIVALGGTQGGGHVRVYKYF